MRKVTAGRAIDPACLNRYSCLLQVRISRGRENRLGVYDLDEPRILYSPAGSVSGEIRIWGSPSDRTLLQAWEAGFQRFQPQVHLVATLHGADSTMAGLYTGVADIALMAREMLLPVESMAFQWVYLYKPTSIEVANAALSGDLPGTQLAIYIRQDNPLPHLTLRQLDAILGAEHLRGGANGGGANVRTWGELGLTGAWQQRAINVYGPEVDGVAAVHVRQVVMLDSRKWNESYHEVASGNDSILRALARDAGGLAVAAAGSTVQGVRMVELGTVESGPFYLPSAQAVADRSYPLTRVITVVLNRSAGAAIDPKIKEFLSYVLSAQGQDVLAKASPYVGLGAASLREQREKLE
jgi:phosphate transport system substrate-binding protein